MVWVTYHLALRPDCQKSLRDELNDLTGPENSDYKGSSMGYLELRNAVQADSFIREVLRMKGDSVNVVRSSIRDVELGGYMIPKGSSSKQKRRPIYCSDTLQVLFFSP